ncbi:BrnA antitoxin family protein [Geminocystis herdmanii]|uniref:BrnA antitoxin family protein n=1 Tax=Geminocystis herdmanii TaxID=669359 RepID=UPI00034A1AD1|nr:BrnA antitoxin family protein [Geminocystis herdmanii]
MNISREEQLKLLSNMKDEEIDFSDIPETDAEFWADAKIDYPNQQVKVILNIDQAILDFFKQQTKGEEYQVLINNVLKQYTLKAQRKINS